MVGAFFTMNTTQHQELLEQFRKLGGSEKLAQSLTPFSLKNFAKLKYELGKIKNEGIKNEELKNEPKTKTEQPKTKNKVFNDLIVDYPLALHPVFRKRWEVWMEACSLKIQLNALGENPKVDIEAIFAIQWKIYRCFQEFDVCQTILKHYREHKRVMPFEVKRDLSAMTEMELFKHRNNLRALITRRKQTIEKMEQELEMTKEECLNKNSEQQAIYKKIIAKKQHSINLKKEQLQEKINELLECNKILNDGEI